MKNNNKKTATTTVNTIRMLGVNAISKAASGHPGIVLGAAPIMYELFFNHLNISPTYYNYFNRDRFVLSAGHGSALLYATLLVSGYKTLTMVDLKNFRQIGAKTAGHPENILIDGIEVSSGPLGQGVAMAVGMAIAETKIANTTDSTDLFDHYTYCLFGDGCFQEGIAHESFSIAGKLKLNKLIMLYDSNDIQLDGKVTDSTKINKKKYFESLGWKYILISDAENTNAIGKAITKAKLSNKPTVIECKTIIGFGSSLAGSNLVHGSPLSKKQLNELKIKLNYDYEDFFIPSEVEKHASQINVRVDKKINKFNNILLQIEKDDIQKYNTILKIISNDEFIKFDYKWFNDLKTKSNEATRNVCGEIAKIIASKNKNLILLNADLSSSTKLAYKKSEPFSSKNYANQDINVGVREFAMGAICNGITAHGGCSCAGSTFLVFSDYNKAAIRLAAVSHLPSINVYSHDSITVGEDGPTHQPIEQIWNLRSIPNHVVFRPTSYIDMIVAWEFAITNTQSPTSIITSRSNFDMFEVDYKMAKNGAYEIAIKDNHDLTIYATGSEIDLAVKVSKLIESKEKIKIRIVAINSLELLSKQTPAYQQKIFDYKPKVCIEFGWTAPWFKYVDHVVGLDSFGISGKPSDVIDNFNLNEKSIASNIIKWYKINNIKKGE